MNVWIWILLYVVIGYVVAGIVTWVAIRQGSLPEGSVIALALLVIFWPLGLVWLAVRAYEELTRRAEAGR